MKNQFKYTISINTGTEEAPVVQKQTATFNIEKVIRSMELPDGRLIVILDDFHEEKVMQPDTVNTSTNRIVKGKVEPTIVQSEIELSAEDKERFLNLLTL